MPIEYEIVESKKLVIAKGTGVITCNDVLRHLDDLSNDNTYIAPMKKLVDYRDISDIQLSSEEARTIADRKKALIKIFYREKCAFVAPEDITFGTSRVHEALTAGVDMYTEVFRNIDDALNWLDVKLDKEI
jgi:hypothetical protein